MISDRCPPTSKAADADGREAAGYDGIGLSLQSVIRLIEDKVKAGFWWHDLHADKITVSPGMARISGIPITVPRTWESMLKEVHPQDRPYLDDLTDLIANGQPSNREFRLSRPDGSIRWISVRIEVMLDEGGHPRGAIGVVVDITDRKEAQRAVEFNLGRRAALLEATSAITWAVHGSGQAFDREAWCALTGMAAESCDGEGWLDAVHPNDREHVRTTFRSVVTQPAIFNIAYRVLTKLGEYRWFNARSAPVRDRAGVVREWQGILVPIDGEHRHLKRETGGGEVLSLTGAQIRGARGLLDWSLAQLALASGVSVSTIKRMEDGSEGITRASKAEAVRRALQTGGVTFRLIDGTTWMGL